MYLPALLLQNVIWLCISVAVVEREHSVFAQLETVTICLYLGFQQSPGEIEHDVYVAALLETLTQRVFFDLQEQNVLMIFQNKVELDPIFVSSASSLSIESVMMIRYLPVIQYPSGQFFNLFPKVFPQSPLAGRVSFFR